VTGCPITRTLRATAGRQQTVGSAPTTYPVPIREHPDREAKMSLPASGGKGPGWTAWLT